jgi:hypothetical protein
VLFGLLALACTFVVTSAFALDINTEVSLQDGEIGVPYQFQFEGEEGCQPYHFNVIAGALPAGLTVQDDGKLVGTPTESGHFDFWVELTDGIPGGACHSPTPSQGEYSVFIAPKIEITTALPGAKAGVPYRVAVAAKGGGTLEWSVTAGSLPPGLALSRTDGTLAGTPSTPGTFPFTVKVNDAKRNATQSFSFVVASPLAVQPTVSLPAAEVGRPLTATIPSAGGIGPLAWSTSGTLPAGLALDPAKGTIQGTPAAAGPFSLAVRATDSDGQAVDTTVSIAVAARPTIVAAPLAKARAGRSYRVRLTARGGVAPRTWRIASGRLPAGIVLARSSGVLAGTPRLAGTYRFTVRLTDRLGGAATRTVSLVVQTRA